MPDKSKLVAHRGFARMYPENSLEAIRAAIELGVHKVEIDIQLAADLTPVLLHDTKLNHTAGVDTSIFNLQAYELKGIETLKQLVSLLKSEPTALAFVELKNESIEFHGLFKCVKAIAEVCSPVIERCVFISFNAAACGLAKACGFELMGWVLPSYDIKEGSRRA